MSKFLQFLLLTVFMTTVSQAQVKHVPLVEEWTQASCGPCAAQNPAFNAKLLANAGSVIAIKYQTWWPGYDPMYLHNEADVRTRVAYYGNSKISGVPTTSMDGIVWPTGQAYPGAPFNLTQAMMDTRKAMMSPIDVQVTHDISDAFDSIFVTVVVKNATDKTYQASNTYLQIAIVEKNIKFATPPGTNGETEFYDVMRKMIPDANGTKLKSFITKGNEVEYTYAIPLPEYLYNAAEINVIAWVQNNSSKEVIQAGESTPIDIAKFNLPDVAVEAEAKGTTGYCDHEFTPELTVKNEGLTDLTGVLVGYSLDGGQNFTVETIAEEIKAGESMDYSFGPATLSAGSVTIVYRAEKPASILQRESDQLNNNFASPAFTLFEKTAWTDEAEFTMENKANFVFPDHIIGEIFDQRIIATVDKSAVGANKEFGGYEKSLKSLLFWYRGITRNSTGQINIQKIDLSQAAKAQMSFDWCMGNPANSANKLEVLATADCGMTWTTIWEAQGDALATATASSAAFFTPEERFWTTINIDLGDFAGEEEVIFRIKMTSAGDGAAVGYMDNIKVERLVTVDNEDISLEANKLQLSPNPVTDILNLEMELATASNVNITIHHMNGQLVDQVAYNQNMTSGAHTIQWNTVNQPAGQYFVKMETADKTTVEKFVIVK